MGGTEKLVTNSLHMSGEVCPYCNGFTVYVDSAEIYGTSYGMIYLCRPCDAYVGVHEGTNRAKGMLANAELRKWRKMAHFHFDQVWKEKKDKDPNARKSMYARLAYLMKLPEEQTHIGMFDVEQCKTVVELCEDPTQWGTEIPSLIEWAQQYGTVIDLRNK